MARNLFDDDDWAHLGSVVGEAVSKQLEVTENGVLARLDKRQTAHDAILEQILARIGVPPQETVMLRAKITNVSALVSQLRRLIGSGNLENELNSQVQNTFDALTEQLAVSSTPTDTAIGAPPEPEEEP